MGHPKKCPRNGGVMQKFCEGEGGSCKNFVKERVGHANIL